MEENKRLDIEFKTTVIRFFKNFMEKADKFNETLEDMKKDQLEIKHTLTEVKNIIQRPNSRLEDRKHQLKDLEYKEAKDTPPEKHEEKRIQKVEDSVRSLWDNFKRTNIRIMGVPEEEREQDAENLFEEIMNENFPHLMKEIDLQVQEAHRTPNKRNPKRTTPRHIIIKMPRAKDKERILQAAREKQLVTYKGAPIRLSANFSTETMQARREWQEIFKVMNSRNLQPRLLYPAKLSFRIEGQIKSFTDKKKLKEFITTKPVLYEMLKGPQLVLSGENDEDVHWSFVHVPVAAAGLHGEKVDQHLSTLSVQEENTAVITCSYSDSSSEYFPWYKQEPGKGPQLIIGIRSNKDKNAAGRLTVFLNKTAKHLSLHIAATQPGDSAVYFCAARTHCFPGTCILYTNLRVGQPLCFGTDLQAQHLSYCLFANGK
ncbi:hypothetical protein QTO34_019488 [Cnephaeus nilssonii]|uniref:Ig-like domain-containing protein n=1 Tax=Cnephaeus nilssonii TaxID=3371016 RepID=A0AA40HWP0_CNENI|nr:hypothetical protein QTO34_019488 [Eptesicus nilssonii]